MSLCFLFAYYVVSARLIISYIVFLSYMHVVPVVAFGTNASGGGGVCRVVIDHAIRSGWYVIKPVA